MFKDAMPPATKIVIGEQVNFAKLISDLICVPYSVASLSIIKEVFSTVRGRPGPLKLSQLMKLDTAP